MGNVTRLFIPVSATEKNSTIIENQRYGNEGKKAIDPIFLQHFPWLKSVYIIYYMYVCCIHMYNTHIKWPNEKEKIFFLQSTWVLFKVLTSDSSQLPRIPLAGYLTPLESSGIYTHVHTPTYRNRHCTQLKTIKRNVRKERVITAIISYILVHIILLKCCLCTLYASHYVYIIRTL